MECQKGLDSAYGNENRANKHFLDERFFKVSYAFEAVTTYVYLINFVIDTKFPQIL